MTSDSTGLPTPVPARAAPPSRAPDESRCAADQAAILSWLNSTAHGDPEYTVADELGIDDSFGADSHFPPAQMDALITAAQDAGVFGIPEHQVELWHVSDNDGRLDGHLIIVERPDGARLASHHLAPADLLDPQLRSFDAAVDLLQSAAAVVDQVVHRAGGQAATPSAAQPSPHRLAAASFATAPGASTGSSAQATGNRSVNTAARRVSGPTSPRRAR